MLTMSRTRKFQFVFLFVGLMMFAVAPTFAQVSIDTEAITDAFQTGINSIFEYMVLFLPVAAIVVGLTVGLPLAFRLLGFIGQMLSKMFGGKA